MVTLTCEDHTDLFWMCKEQAVSESGRYNGARNIFFLGRVQPDGKLSEFNDETREMTRECPCHASKLIKAERPPEPINGR